MTSQLASIKRSVLSAIMACALTGALVAPLEAMPFARGLSIFTTAMEKAKAPIGWDAFCARYASECKLKSSDPREFELSPWDASNGASEWVNKNTDPVAESEDWIKVSSWGHVAVAVDKSSSVPDFEFASWSPVIGLSDWANKKEIISFEQIDPLNKFASPIQGRKIESVRKIEVTPATWQTITSVNSWVNSHVKPMTDAKHFGTVNKWVYPDDGKGDCKAYTLLKRRKLIEAGLPSEALLITIVWTKQNLGHAVLMARTDKGDYILDNLSSNVLLWTKTTHDYVKRQSVSDPNTWVFIDGYRQKQPVTVANVNVYD